MTPVDEWVEVAGPTVEVAIDAALQELGLTSRDEVEVEVIQEASKGILGTGWRAQDAVVKVTPKLRKDKKRRRRRSRKKPSSKDTAQRTEDGAKRSREKPRPQKNARTERSGARSSDGGGGKGNRSNKGRSPDRAAPKAAAVSHAERDTGAGSRPAKPEEATIDEQATVAADFIKGLLEAFGLEGSVETEIDEDILRINVTGDQTEALVGRKGAIMQSVHEITRTVVQRKTFGAPRMRLDINGYGERRREALRIYSARQAERVLADGGEIMLEPMNPADRKVIHDAVGEIDGVQSYSEGEDPHRAVVIAPDDTKA